MKTLSILVSERRTKTLWDQCPVPESVPALSDSGLAEIPRQARNYSRGADFTVSASARL